MKTKKVAAGFARWVVLAGLLGSACAAPAPAPPAPAATAAPIQAPTAAPPARPTAAPAPTAAAAAKPAGVYGGTGRVLGPGYPEVWDPHIAGTNLALSGFGPMYNQVVEYDPVRPGKIIGDLAKDWEVGNGGLTYTFHLNPNIKWWDGRDLTADDVAFSISRMVQPGQPRPRVGLLRSYVKSATAVDRTTVKVDLNFPGAAFLPFLAVDYMKVVPKHLIDGGVDINLFDNLVGSGPFKKVRTVRGDSTTYEKNTTYFKAGRPFLDGLRVFAVADPGTVAAVFRTAQVDSTTVNFGLGIPDVLRLAPELAGKYTVYWHPTVNDTQHFLVNATKAPWSDMRLIKALSLATDRQEFIKAFGGGKYTIGAPFPTGSWYGSTQDELLKRPGYRIPKDKDIEEAKALLKEAGYDPPSKLTNLVLLSPKLSDLPDWAQLWKAQLKRNLGLDLTIEAVDAPTGIARHSQGDFSIGQFGYGLNILDPDDYVGTIYGTGARNFSRWKNPDFLKMLEQQSREQDLNKRRALLRDMEEFLFTKENPYITVWWFYRFYLVNDKVRTEAGPFIAPETPQIVLKQEHWWLEK